MKTEQIKRLLDRYFEGETTLEEEKRLRAYFSGDDVAEELQSYTDQFRYAEYLHETETQADPLAKMEAADKRTGVRRDDTLDFSRTRSRPRFTEWSLRIAAGLILLLAGFSAGLMVGQTDGTGSRELAALREEVRQMKGALMYGDYRQSSASERISAVNMSARLSQSKQLDEEITEILIYTMNNDENVNVRLAAAEALFKFRDAVRVGEALTNALSRQDDPLMQITLIDMLVKIREKGAISEMQKMLMNSETQEIVRQRLQSGIAELRI